MPLVTRALRLLEAADDEQQQRARRQDRRGRIAPSWTDGVAIAAAAAAITARPWR